jgi:hypothetical protein
MQPLKISSRITFITMYNLNIAQQIFKMNMYNKKDII